MVTRPYSKPGNEMKFNMKSGSILAFGLCLISSMALAGPLNVYRIIQGHDGNPDPDDNLAQLAGVYAIYRNQQEHPTQIQMVGFITGDTKEVGKTAMKSGNGPGAGNYGFYKQYAASALQTIYSISSIHDCVTQVWNLNAASASQLTSGGQMTYTAIVAAINNKDSSKNFRVVYSAGGGQNVAYEAIQLLIKHGYSIQQIKDHFAIVQHGLWNLDHACEANVKAGTMPYTIRIIDQNQFSGTGKTPKNVSASVTSDVFKTAWDIARGNKIASPGISHFISTSDASDAGSHHFASNLEFIEANWHQRNNEASQISYRLYTSAEITKDLNQGVTGLKGLNRRQTPIPSFKGPLSVNTHLGYISHEFNFGIAMKKNLLGRLSRIDNTNISMSESHANLDGVTK